MSFVRKKCAPADYFNRFVLCSSAGINAIGICNENERGNFSAAHDSNISNPLHISSVRWPTVDGTRMPFEKRTVEARSCSEEFKWRRS